MQLAKCPVTQKRLAVAHNGLKFGVQRVFLEHIWGTFGLVAFKVDYMSFGVHSSQNGL